MEETARQKRAVGNSGLNVPLIIRYPNKMMLEKLIIELYL